MGNLPARLPDNYGPFVVDVPASDVLLNVTLRMEAFDGCLPAKMGEFSDLGYRQEVYQYADGRYGFRIFDTSEELAVTMISDADFRNNDVWVSGATAASRVFGFNNSLMIAFAFASAYHDTLMMHSSVVKLGDWAYMFLGKSGTGKSTHSKLWLKHIPHTHLLNDDNPVLRIKDGVAMVYGSPWSGKTPCYRQENAKVGALVMLEQKPYNKIKKDDVIGALAALLCSCSIMIWDKPSYNAIMQTLSSVIAKVGVHHLECLPDEAAAKVCYSAVAKRESSVEGNVSDSQEEVQS